MKNYEISASILNSDFSCLEKVINDLSENGIKYLHFDVMDGHFVPNLSFGSSVLASINKDHKLINDVHLMVDDPRLYIDSFVKANADIITIHYECFKNEELLLDEINYIKSKGVKVGLSIKPKTDVKAVFKFLKYIDVLLVMSVEPGFGGQKFIVESLKKIGDLDAFRKKEGLFFKIEVDGGINNFTYKNCVLNGADLLVVGSYLFKNDLKEAIKTLKE